MFVTAPDGRLIASVPSISEMAGRDFDSSLWREQTAATSGVFVSPVHHRFPDKRVVTDIVGAVRGPDRAIVGYLGISVLVERIGRRLSTIEFADQSFCEVFDQKGTALFDKDFRPSLGAVSQPTSILLQEIAKRKRGHFELRERFTFSP